MGLKGYRLWVMGQLDSNVQSPTAVPAAAAERREERFEVVAVEVGAAENQALVHLVVALQVEFEGMEF
jgi:hypothetical protein